MLTVMGRSEADPLRGDTRGHGLVVMIRAGLESPEERQALPAAAALACLSWFGFMAISGVHLGGSWGPPFVGMMPRSVAFGATLVTLLAVAGCLGSRGGVLARDLSAFALMAAAYLVGNGLSGFLHVVVAPDTILADAPVALRFIASRCLYGFAVSVPMLLAWRGAYGGWPGFLLSLGDWSVKTRLGRSDPLRSWRALLPVIGVLVGVPFFFLLQWQVDFGPMASGRLPALLPWIAAMAVANATAEELVFRGFLQGAAVRAVGAPLGMWLIAMVFGLHHWGASFAPLASMGGALAVGVGSVLFAKSAHETGGLAWAIVVHALFNVGTFAAFYVAT